MAALHSAHRVLILYFEAVPAVERPRTLDDLQPLIELYHHMVRAGQLDAACTLLSSQLIPTPLFYQFGAYELCIELLRTLFPDGEERPPRLQNEGDQAWTLNSLANSYSLSGQPRRAVPLFEQQIAIREKQDNKRNLAIGLGNLAYIQLPIGALRAAANLRRSIDLSWEIGDERNEAIGHKELGRVLVYCGQWKEAETALDSAMRIDEKRKDIQAQGLIWAYRALWGLLRLRDTTPPPNLPPLGGGTVASSTTPPPSLPQFGGGTVASSTTPPPNLPHAGGGTVASSTSSQLPPLAQRPGEGRGGVLEAARRALELADERQKQVGRPNARDYVDAHWLLGAAHRVNHDFAAADHHLSEALTRCRSINLVDHEADILLDLARLRWALRQAQGPGAQAETLHAEALQLAQDALLITERSGYVLQGADVRLFLAAAALAAGDRAAAQEHATAARDLAYCDGPPYSYKVAHEEAVALLAQLNGDS